jgi:hypothetical protein
MKQNILTLHPKINRYDKSGAHQMGCMDCPLNTQGRQVDHFTLDIKNIYRQSELIIVAEVIPVIH